MNPHSDCNREKPLDSQKSYRLPRAADNPCFVEAGRLTDGEWSSIMQGFEDTTLFQTWAYGSVHWGEKTLYHLVVRRKNGDLIGGAQARRITVPLIGRGLIYVPWGPLWWPKGKERNLENVRWVARAMTEEYVVRRRMALMLIPNVAENELDAPEIKGIMEEEGFTYMPDLRRTILLDLRPTEAEMKRCFSRNWKWNLKRAEKVKHRLGLVEGTNIEHFKSFLTLYQEMRSRKGFVPGVVVEEFPEIQRRLPEGLQMKVTLCYCDEKLVSGTVFSPLGHRGLMLLAATNPTGRDLGASHHVWWHILQVLKAMGCMQCDLGGIDPVEAPGPYRFKKGLGGVEAARLGCFFRSPHKIENRLLILGYKLRPFLRKIKVSLAGQSEDKELQEAASKAPSK